jgi:hypothetical protein
MSQPQSAKRIFPQNNNISGTDEFPTRKSAIWGKLKKIKLGRRFSPIPADNYLLFIFIRLGGLKSAFICVHLRPKCKFPYYQGIALKAVLKDSE